MGPDPVLRLDAVAKIFPGGLKALDDVSQQMDELEIVDIVQEDLHPTVSASHDVPEQPGGLNSSVSGHRLHRFMNRAVLSKQELPAISFHQSRTVQIFKH